MNFDNINGFEDFMNMFNRPSEGYCNSSKNFIKH